MSQKGLLCAVWDRPPTPRDLNSNTTSGLPSQSVCLHYTIIIPTSWATTRDLTCSQGFLPGRKHRILNRYWAWCWTLYSVMLRSISKWNESWLDFCHPQQRITAWIEHHHNYVPTACDLTCRAKAKRASCPDNESRLGLMNIRTVSNINLTHSVESPNAVLYTIPKA